jgi:hypothetical protein
MAEAMDTSTRQVEAGKGPVFFVGQPPFLTGQIELRNRSTERLKLKQLPLSGLPIETAGGERLNTVRLLARLAPGQRAKVPARLELSPGTPPGTYQGEIECGGKSRPVTVQVLESWKLELIPSSISFKVRSNERVSCSIQVTNVGNMPYTLHGTAVVPLRERNGPQDALCVTLKGPGVQGLEKALDELVGRLSEHDAGFATVEIKTDNRILSPGETRVVELKFHAPETLKKDRLYAGTVLFENARLRFDLEILTISEKGKV